MVAQTVLLSKVLGLFLIIVGALVAVQRNDFIGVVQAFTRDRLLRVVVSAIEMIAALFLIMLHNDFSSVPAMIIAVLGWMALIESIVYFALSNSVTEAIVDVINTPMLFLTGGILSAGLGIYLSAWGFGVL